ncbi:uncharacterized protein LOC112091560 [Morus notabilis]|uniref:uncharacterized protein LOC112091560 n=1 Tax=Morus notabilis TaxID=981085 RepID=UPI000CED0E3A|nr:uncharacterized protein LOC112091560 [Morus notabilis]
MGDVAGLKKNIGQVAEVVNVDITPSRTHDHPFTEEIMAPPIPDKYRSLSIPPYDGRGDPDDHLEMYTGHMLLHGYADEIMSNKNKGTKQRLTTGKQDGKKRRGRGSGDKQSALAPTTPEAKKPRQEENRKPRPFQRYDSYHELTVGVEEVFNQVGRGNLLRRPEPMRSDPSQRNQKKYCSFHGNVGHHTNDCTNLKDEIERVIREVRLQEFKVERRPRNDDHGCQNDGRRREENQRPEDREPIGVIRTVLGGPYIGGDSMRSQKDYAHEAKRVYQERFWNVSATKATRFGSADVAFNEDDANGVHFPHNDTLVVEAVIRNHTVCQILVDNGNSVDLLYSDCLEKMGIPMEHLKKTSRLLYGFTGDSVISQGTIRLPITAREKPRQATIMANFVVIKGGSQYNAVIGRATLQVLRAITSIYHQKVKFPTPNGVGEIKNNQYEARVAYSDALCGYDEPGRQESRVVYQGAVEDIDPRVQEEAAWSQLVERLVEIQVDEDEPTRVLKVGSDLTPSLRVEVESFLKKNLDVFAWNHADMEGIDPKFICHFLNIDPSYPPKCQKRRPMNPEGYEALKEEVDKLINKSFIREAHYLRWVSNPVLVVKPNGTRRTCLDFSDLNKACPKDGFPLPRIDQMVDATAGHEMLSFMDAYSGYNQIPMHPTDEKHTSFITDRGLYYYKVMPFGLKNAWATYQRLVNKMFAQLLGKSMEVYIDDMLVKSTMATQHVDHLGEMFGVLRRYNMRLNPLKCAFGVGSAKFICFMVNNRGIEANPEKIKALQDMRSPTKPKEVQRLTGCVAALNIFISKATDKCVPFFDALKGSKHFEWTPQCEEAFQKLKEHLGRPPILSKPITNKELSLYLSVSQHAESSVLIREEEKVQLLVYYVSKRLIDAESRYTEIEQLALALMFDIKYVPRVAIKGQALANFLAEFSHRTTPATHDVETTKWRLYVDGASSENGSGAGVLLISPKGYKITSAVRFKFKVSNNEAEYETLIAGLRLANHLKVERLGIFSNSQLVVGQVNEEYPARGEKMGAYLRKVKEELVRFKSYEILQIPRAENTNTDALAKLASSRDSDILGIVPIEELERPTIEEKIEALTIQTNEGWMTPLIQYLTNEKLPSDKDEARRIRYRVARYLLYDGLLYRRGYSTPLQRCINDGEAQKVLQEIHEGVCGNHTGGQSLALKVLRQGYYWRTLKKDAFQYARHCDKCQKYTIIPIAPPENLTPILSPWPFTKWGVDLIGPLHLTPRGFKFAIVVVDYYTKWAEAKALTTTTEAICTNFMWNNIVCRFGVPH